MIKSIFHADWKKETKKVCVHGFSLLVMLLIWTDYVFRPVDNALRVYTNNYTQDADPVMILGMDGFLALSAFFLFTYGANTVSFVIFKAMYKIENRDRPSGGFIK